jgi:hypothetical protein
MELLLVYPWKSKQNVGILRREVWHKSMRRAQVGAL